MMVKKKWLWILTLVVSVEVLAGGQGGMFRVASLRVGSDATFVQFDPAPSACNGGSHYRMHARVKASAMENYDAMVSTLLSAYMAEQRIRYIWYHDLPSGVQACNDAGGILDITMIELRPK